MDVRVTWTGGGSFEAITDRGVRLALGDPGPAGSQDGAFRPMELIAVGVASCTAMDVISILGKKRQAVTAFEVQAHFERSSEHPKVFTSAALEYVVTGRGIDIAAVVRSIELSITRYCPAHAMLAQAMPFELKYRVYEANENGGPIQTGSGAYVATDAQAQT